MREVGRSDRQQGEAPSRSAEPRLPRAQTSRWDLGISLAIALYGLGITVWLLAHRVQVTQEDGYYYYRIAQQMAQGAGSTFDGLHPTNGYHPLWLLCLTPLFRLAPTAESAVTLSTLLQGGLMAACSALVYRTARSALGQPAAALAALFWIGLTYRLALSGLEFGLHALCVLATAGFYLSRFATTLTTPSPRSYGALGLLLGLAFLARLDTLLLAGILGAFLATRERQAGWERGSLIRLSAFSLPIVALCLLYGAIEMARFGHALPISGVVKREVSLALLRQDPLYRAHGWAIAKGLHLLWPLRTLQTYYPVAIGVFAAPLLPFVGGFGIRTDGEQDRFWRALGPFLVYSVAQFGSAALLYHGDLSGKPWYYVVQPWLTALLAGRLFQAAAAEWNRTPGGGERELARKWKQQGATLLLGVALVAVWCAVPLKTLLGIRQWEANTRAGGEHPELALAARWIRTHLPPDAVIGTWNAGTIGFLSDRRVVNLDGLVNSWDYVQTDRQDLDRYFRTTGITYLVDAFENGHVLTGGSGLAGYAPPADAWELIWSDARTDRSWHMEAYRRIAPE